MIKFALWRHHFPPCATLMKELVKSAAPLLCGSVFVCGSFFPARLFIQRMLTLNPA